MTKLQELNNQGNTIILITHDNHLALMAKRIITIQDGKIVSDKTLSASERVLAGGVSNV